MIAESEMLVKILVIRYYTDYFSVKKDKVIKNLYRFESFSVRLELGVDSTKKGFKQSY